MMQAGLRPSVAMSAKDTRSAASPRASRRSAALSSATATSDGAAAVEGRANLREHRVEILVVSGVEDGFVMEAAQVSSHARRRMV